MRRTLVNAVPPLVVGTVLVSSFLTGSLTAAPAAAAACPSPGGVQVAEAKGPSGAEVVVRGHGWGHGMGMSQYGAQGAARLGCDYKTILTTYYRGTSVVTRAMDDAVRLSLDSGLRATLTAEQGAVTWRGAAGATATQPEGITWSVARAVRADRNGSALLDSAGGVRLWVPSGTALVAPHARRTVRLRSYHTSSWPAVDLRLRQGTLRVTRDGSQLVVTERIAGDSTHTAVQKYLWGLGEVPVSWPAQALRTQVVAARTFLSSKHDSAAGLYKIGITTSDQVYRGADGEDNDARYGAGWKAAVTATKGALVVDGDGRIVTTMYSSSMGGHTENRAYVYGSQGGYGYLTGVDDSRWDAASDNPYRSWAKGYSRVEFARLLGFSSVSSVSVGEPGTAARDQGVVVRGVRSGAAATRTYNGASFRSALGLRSPGITVQLGIGGSGAQPLAGDWDADGRTDTGWYRNPYISLRTATGTVTRYRFDVPGARAVVGDFDGNGYDSVSLFKDGTWHLRNGRSTTATTSRVSFGRTGDVPVAGRWNTLKSDGIGVVRGLTWYLRPRPASATPARRFEWRVSHGTPVVGDWDGDGVDGPGIRKGTTWFLGKNVPVRGTGVVAGPRLDRSFTYSLGTDRITAGSARGRPGSTPTVVRGTDFLWRAALTRPAVIRQAFPG
jgi:stage II sporulation protein D